MDERSATADDLAFDRSFAGGAGELVRVSALVRRMAAGNPGPMTFTGTCTYVVGAGEVAIIDPGPDREAHVEALLHALRGETIAAILVTHTHKDHSPAARALKAATGAPIIGCAPYAPPGKTAGAPPGHIPISLKQSDRQEYAQASKSGAISYRPNESVRSISAPEGPHDKAYAPDLILREGEAFEARDFALIGVETPGHTANHLAFFLPQEQALFSGDHVMAWSTSLVTPPDGSMRDYMASLEKLRRRDDRIYWPGHGGPVAAPQRYVRALANHRRQRERAILARLEAGDCTIAAIVADVYAGLAPDFPPPPASPCWRIWRISWRADLSLLRGPRRRAPRSTRCIVRPERSRRLFPVDFFPVHLGLERGLEYGDVVLVGAEIEGAEARGGAKVNARLPGERADAQGDIAGKAQNRAAGDGVDMADAHAPAGRDLLDEAPAAGADRLAHRRESLVRLQIEQDGQDLRIGLRLHPPRSQRRIARRRSGPRRLSNARGREDRRIGEIGRRSVNRGAWTVLAASQAG